jgi:hypothetical protein
MTGSLALRYRSPAPHSEPASVNMTEPSTGFTHASRPRTTRPHRMHARWRGAGVATAHGAAPSGSGVRAAITACALCSIRLAVVRTEPSASTARSRRRTPA